jgi:hypothetical protein
MRDEKLKLEDLKASRALCGALKAFPSTYYVFFFERDIFIFPTFFGFYFFPLHFRLGEHVRRRGLSPRPIPAGVVASSETRAARPEANSLGAAEDALLLQALHHITQGGNAPRGNAPPFDGGKAGGHRRADARCATARPPASHGFCLSSRQSRWQGA